MNILKHGVTTKEEAKSEKFKCEQCGCEFDADYDEYYVDEGSRFMDSSVTTYTFSMDVTDVYVCSCPECHKIVTKTKTRAIAIPTTITYTDSTDPCTNCSNNPKNGGSGICLCSLGNKIKYTAGSETTCECTNETHT